MAKLEKLKKLENFKVKAQEISAVVLPLILEGKKLLSPFLENLVTRKRGIGKRGKRIFTLEEEMDALQEVVGSQIELNKLQQEQIDLLGELVETLASSDEG